MLAALDLATGQLTYRIRGRKRWQEFLNLLTILRRRYPAERLYLILDNFVPHKRTEVTAWCEDNNVELVFIPTYASWLNWIEAEFAALRYFALNGTDHRSQLCTTLTSIDVKPPKIDLFDFGLDAGRIVEKMPGT